MVCAVRGDGVAVMQGENEVYKLKIANLMTDNEHLTELNSSSDVMLARTQSSNADLENRLKTCQRELDGV